VKFGVKKANLATLVHLYFVKRSMSESAAMFPQVWKIH